MDKLMDSDYETMFTALMEEEVKIAVADDEEHLMMLSCLMALYTRNAAARRVRAWMPQEQVKEEVGRLLHSLH
jgi:hypothetical protein